MTWLLDTLGYDTVDIGTLADSWRSEPNSPVYVQPYLPAVQPSAGQDPWELFTMPGTPTPAARIKELVDAAVRGPIGGVFPGSAQD
ncbi:hypothetical protein ALI22I_07325 [Saccharothrix sp. ALI-22-I]|nr:hypothetical protein ALI22I_07325 [Saccharothrix sp. ALI-22-I]